MLELVSFPGLRLGAYAIVSALSVDCVDTACAVCSGSSETEGVREENVLQVETEDPGGEIPGLCHG